MTPHVINAVGVNRRAQNGDTHLLVTVALEDGLGVPVSGATVSVVLYRDGSPDASRSGTTGTAGTVTFSRKSAPSGCYSTTVTDVNGTTPLREPAARTAAGALESAKPRHYLKYS